MIATVTPRSQEPVAEESGRTAEVREVRVVLDIDAHAPIFKLAHLRIVGDFKAILPPFVRKCRELVED